MFVPVACLRCGKPFQVPPATAGTDVTCPWCKGSTPALPVVLVAGATPPTPPKPEPLPLEDLPPPQPLPTTSTGPVPKAPHPEPVRAGFPYRTAALVLLATAVVFVGTFFVLRWINRRSDTASAPGEAVWAEFTPPDQSWSAVLPGPVTEQVLAPGAGGPGEQVVGTDPRQHITAWVGWRDLTAEWAAKARTKPTTKEGNDEPRFLLDSVFRDEERRLAKEWGAGSVQVATKKFANPLTVEFRAETPKGVLIERAIVRPEHPRPRIYLIGVIAPAAHPRTEQVLDSFRVW